MYGEDKVDIMRCFKFSLQSGYLFLNKLEDVDV